MNMDKTQAFFQEYKSYFKINMISLSLLGQWPYQSAIVNFIMFAMSIMLGPSISIPQIIAMYELRSNVSDVLECLTSIIVSFLCIVKLINLSMNKEKITKLLIGLANNWKSLKTKQELEILHDYTKFGKYLVITYVIYMCLIFVTYMQLPRFSTVTIKQIPGTNKTIGIKLSPIIVDYKVDEEKFYYPIFFHIYAGAFYQCTITATPDILFIALVQHVRGMFEALGYELTNAVKDEDLNIKLNPELKDDKTYEKLTNAIKRHGRIIDFINLIESTYTISFFFQVGLNMIMLSITVVQTLAYSYLLHEFIRYTCFVCAQLLHLFFECWQAQQLMDSGNRIHYYTYISRWYCMSLRSRKLLILIMMRTKAVCKITAGKVYTLSFQSFSAVVRTSLSYIAVIQSIR